jgi:hypothetical protein
MIEVIRYIVNHSDRSEHMVLATEFDRVTAERDALQLRLNAADHRIDELTAKPSDAERERLRAVIENYPNGDPLEYNAAVRAITQRS